MQIELIQGQVIEDQAIRIDCKEFRDCTLVRCVLEYSGEPVIFERTQFQSCRYVFFGHARGTVQFLQNVGLMPYDPSEWAEFSDEIH